MMNMYGVDYVKFAIKDMSEYIIEKEVEFCELDSIAGDGDFGMSVAKGFRIVNAEIDTLNSEDIGVFLNECGKIIYEHCGGASGPIWGAGFRAAAKVVRGKKEVSAADIADGLKASAEKIMKVGGAKQGDKTLLDTLIPAVQSLHQSVEDGFSVQKLLMQFSEAAMIGAESTKDIIASKGRASYLGERSIGYPDAGAMALAMIINHVVNSLLKLISIK
jgi:dihydroxyacetone kinase